MMEHPATRRWFAWWLAASLCAAVLSAQRPIRFARLSLEEGLSQNTVATILQDREGYLWFGTEAGLDRYDGRSFHHYYHDSSAANSLPGSYVSSLAEDQHGDLWIATTGGGLARWERRSDRFTSFRHDPEDGATLASNQLLFVHVDSAGQVWVGTRDQGLDRLDPATGAVAHYRHDPADPSTLSHDEVTVILPAGHGAVSPEGGRTEHLWIGTGGGLNRLDPATGRFVRYQHDPEDAGSLAGDWIRSLFEDSRGDLWVGTHDSGLHRLAEPGSGRFERFRHDEQDPASLSSDRVRAILEDDAGRFWVGTSAGLDLLDRQRQRFAHYRHDPGRPDSLAADYITAIHQDRGGVLWVGARFGGLARWNPRTWSFGHHAAETGGTGGPGHPMVTSFAVDSAGRLWVGALGGGLSGLDRATGRWRRYRAGPGGLSGDRVTALWVDRQDKLWIGTLGQGLDRFDPAAGTFERFRADSEARALGANLISSLGEDGTGSVWVGTFGGGISRFDLRTERWTRITSADDPDLGAARVICFARDPAGSMWAGTDGQGLYLFDGSARLLRRYVQDQNDPGALSADPIYALHVDSTGALWIGTRGGWLQRAEGSSRAPDEIEFRHFTARDGLLVADVYGIESDAEGHLWLATNRGLTRFHPDRGSAKHYNRRHGLQSNEFNVGAHFSSADGELFFGGIQGFNAFFPAKLEENGHEPPVVLRALEVNNRPVAVQTASHGTGVELGHRDVVVTFEFAALDFAAPEENRYAHKLEGFDEDWVELGNESRVTYTNLDAGSYRLEARAANNDGVWSRQPLEIPLVVRPAPWNTRWAYSLYGLALAGGVLSYVRSHRRQLRRERAVNARLREVDRLKDEFLANTSHELRTPLYGITGLAESLIDGAAGEASDAMRANLSMIVASGRRLGRLVDDILDHSRLTHESLELRRAPVDLRTLTEVVLTLQEPLAAGKGLTLINAVAPNLPAADADEARLEQILHNLVGNAVKFTEAGEVEVAAAVEEDPPILRITVADTGIGIPRDQQEVIFEAFEQADSGLQRAFGGTGLGLTVTRELVELHGGRIGVESTVGQGTRFSFTLPISDRKAEPAPVSGQPLSRLVTAEPVTAFAPAGGETGRPPPIAGGASPRPPSPASSARANRGPRGRRILVVDDEPVILQLLSNQLASAGYEVALAGSGPDALRLVEEGAFDLVVLDVMMPRMSGYEVCRALRERFSLEELPVIFLTAKKQVPDLVAGLAAGGNDYLPKPVGKDELLARVRIHLELLSSHRRLARKNAELARFNYAIAHDLRNPLTTIKNYVGLARRDASRGETDRLERDLDRLQTAADRLHLLLGELYEFSKVGRPADSLEEVALEELVRTLLADLGGAIAECGAVVEVASELPAVRGDRAQLAELLRHLIHNALQYSASSETPRVEIGMRPGGTEPVFYVRDNGRGIDPRYHDRIFDLFESLDPAASKGTGIGLALARRILETHGGRIWVESEGPGHGSTFCFTLALASARRS